MNIEELEKKLDEALANGELTDEEARDIFKEAEAEMMQSYQQDQYNRERQMEQDEMVHQAQEEG